MPDDGIERTFWNALHATPTATHVNKGGIFSIKSNKGAAAAHLLWRASQTGLTKLIIYFDTDQK